jgi:hypothetical protein
VRRILYILRNQIWLVVLLTEMFAEILSIAFNKEPTNNSYVVLQFSVNYSTAVNE